MYFDEDRLVREIKRLSETIARAVGLKNAEAQEEAEAGLGELHRSIFGLDVGSTRRLHPSSLAAMVSPQHRAAAVAVLRADADLLEARGETGLAALRRSQADSLA
ncbi:MAG: hypothetical protein J0L92_19875 [Deltaproteobacteria bacterium]|nr:hypothetical protein [Deltaproteobacteria bacterium]